MKTAPFLALLVAFVLVSRGHGQDRNLLFGLEARGMVDGALEAGLVESSLEEISVSENKFTISFSQDSEAKAEVVQLDAGGKALRISPGSQGEKGSAAALGLRDESVGGMISADLPMFIEVVLRRSSGPISLGVSSHFKRDDALVSTSFGALVGHVTPEGTYSAFRTLYTTPPDEIRGPSLPAEEIVTILYQLTQTAEGLQVTTEVKTGEETLFETGSEPAFVENLTLDTFQRFDMVVSAAPGGTGEEFLDLISVKAWQ